jgi:psp operon transcriptional activator
MPDSTNQIEWEEALGQSEAFLAFQEAVSAAARVDRPVLLAGERGTGKELAARRLHYLSARWEEPLVALNCAALAPALIESELFGHEAGAFTGAVQRRRGRFEAADNGTLFLDELGNIPLPVQEKILRAVEYGVFERVGGSEPVRVNVRIVGATNADLPALAEEGRFMRDLLDRLSFEVLYVPPLRERPEDILLLSRHFAARMAYELGLDHPPEISEEAEAALLEHPWRGNVRELKNVVERAVYRATTDSITTWIFDPFRPAATPITPPPESRESTHGVSPLSFSEAVAAYEVRLLRDALEGARHNQRKAAKRLGLTYHQFRGLYRKYSGALEG